MGKKYFINKKILITQAASRIGYFLTYSLGSKGICVHCADKFWASMSKFSKYCSRFHTYPDPNISINKYFKRINNIVQEFSIDYIFPAYDEIFFLAKYNNLIEKKGLLLIPTFEQLMIVHNKLALHNLCRLTECNSPDTYSLKTEYDLDYIYEKLTFPFVLKPERGAGGWGVTFVNNKEECKKIWKNFDQKLHNNRLFAQQYISGNLYGHGTLCYNGNILASNTYHTIRQYPIGRGQPSFREGKIVEEIDKQSSAILSRLNWTGVCQMNFLHDEDNGKFYLIDVNPRFWGSTVHGFNEGMNYAFLLFLLLSNQHDGRIIKDLGNQTTSAWIWGDFNVMLDRLISENNRNKIIIEHIKSWRNAYWEDLRKEDILPFIFYPIQKLISLFYKNTEGGF